MLRKVDAVLIDSIDWVTTKVQRKGWVPLNTIIMVTELAIYLGYVVHVDVFNIKPVDFLVSPFIIGGVMLAYQTWRNAIGYWENYRKMLALNAIVQLHRGQIVLRWGVMIAFGPMIFVDLFFGLLSYTVGTIALVLVYWLKCCRFIGPGEYEHERQTILQGKTEW